MPNPVPANPQQMKKSSMVSSYIVRNIDEVEQQRLILQDKLTTIAMGGVLPEQADPTLFSSVLDVGCGTGGWLIEAAKTYPGMKRLVGIDFSPLMIEYARAQAVAEHVADRVMFEMMDAQQKLDFPDGTFDLVNVRFAMSFVRTYDWQRMMREWLRVARVGGVVRITESEVATQSSSDALKQLYKMLEDALYKTGYLFTHEYAGVTSRQGLTSRLEKQLMARELRVKDVQTHAYELTYQHGTPEIQGSIEELMKHTFQVVRPFLQRYNCLDKDYDSIYQQALAEMQQPDFYMTGKLLTLWCHKPPPGRVRPRVGPYHNIYEVRGPENTSTYVIDSREDDQERKRLEAQDKTITTMMGGVLPEQADPNSFHSVLDVGCGTGGWLIEAAKTYLGMTELVGIDTNKRMIEYARSQVPDELTDYVEFRVMSALQSLYFSSNVFDLVNVRLAMSFVRTFEWEEFVTELLRVVRPGGVLRLTEADNIESNSPALTRLCEMSQSALYKSKALFTNERTGLTSHLRDRLRLAKCKDVRTRGHVLHYFAGTPEGQAFYEDMKVWFKLIHPFIAKYASASKDYNAIYQQMLVEIQQPDFHATWNFLTAWGIKPNPGRVTSREQVRPLPWHEELVDVKGSESPSTYFVDSREDDKEHKRLDVQDKMLTRMMGGVLPEQADPYIFHNVLDVACGTGGWLIEAAKAYPSMTRLVGIDISQKMIEFARQQVPPEVAEYVRFHVMNVNDGLDFPTNTFDLVNARLALSFLRIFEWSEFVSELLRVTRPGGVVRLTEIEIIIPSTSSALTQLCEMMLSAMYKAKNLFTNDTGGVTNHLAQQLLLGGCKDVQTQAYALQYDAGTPEVQALYEDLKIGLKLAHPFIAKYNSASKDYNAIYQQALEDTQGPDFHATWNYLTAWGTKPGYGGPTSQAPLIRAKAQDTTGRENPSTYFIDLSKDNQELKRLDAQDKMLTRTMGGVLPEQADPNIFHNILDVACGTGGWLIEAAKTYSGMTRLVGIDISKKMIEFARAHVPADVADYVELQVMNVHNGLSFPDNTFDLVNLRLALSFLRTFEWREVVAELLRVTRPGGIVRLTECEVPIQSTSPALTQLYEMALSAFYKAMHFFTNESGGVTNHLAQQLTRQGCKDVRTQAYTLHYDAGTPEGRAFYEDMAPLFTLIRPFITKYGSASKDYDTIYQQALEDMQGPDFHATWNFLTAWGSKPGEGKVASQAPIIRAKAQDTRGRENSSTYVIDSRKDDQEHRRLDLQDKMLTRMMGGALPEQADPNSFHNVLDVACGTGGWLIEAAKTYPGMTRLVGIDISKKMIEFARAHVPADVADYVEFQVMNVHDGLSFPDNTFDLVNARFAAGFVRTFEWQDFVTELLRVTRPGGVVRLTECECRTPSNSNALTRLWEMLVSAGYKAMHLFTENSVGLTDHLAQLLSRHGLDSKDVRTQAYTLHYDAGTPEADAFYADMVASFTLIRPFITKYGSATKDYDAIYQQALEEMQRPDFHATWNLLTAWCIKPGYAGPPPEEVQDTKGRENPSTYVIDSRDDDKEHKRLDLQDKLITRMMGGVLPEQADPNSFHNVLDVACGTGGWLIEAAKTYPGMTRLVGIDISKKMIEFARQQVPPEVADYVTFHVMNVHDGLRFPDNTFDLVNIRGATSFLRTFEWGEFVTELLHVTRPGSIVRLTEAESITHSNSSALTQLWEMLSSALYKAKHLFTNESGGVTNHLAQQLLLGGCKDVQTQAYTLHYDPGIPEGQAFYEDWKVMFKLIRPFIAKYHSASKDYDAIYQQALEEMQRPDFHATLNLLTAWGIKP